MMTDDYYRNNQRSLMDTCSGLPLTPAPELRAAASLFISTPEVPPRIFGGTVESGLTVAGLPDRTACAICWLLDEVGGVSFVNGAGVSLNGSSGDADSDVKGD